MQTEPQIKSVKINFYDLYYTVIRNRDEKETENDKYENKENDYTKYDLFRIPKCDLGFRPRETILR